MSSGSFLDIVVFPEQVCLEPFLEGGETVSFSDGGGELIPPLGGQTGEELVLGPAVLSGGTTRRLSVEDRRWRVGV